MVEAIFKRDELKNRLDQLQESINAQGLDGVLLLQRADLIYYTGAAFQGALIIPASGQSQLFVWRGQGRISSECPLEPLIVKGFGKLTLALKEAGVGQWKKVGWEEDVVPVSWFKRIMGQVWPDAESVDISNTIRVQRSVKSESELDLIRESGKIITAGFQALKTILKEGIPEYEAQAQMDVAMRRAGDQAGGRTRGFNAEARGVVSAGNSASTISVFDGPIGQPGRNPLAPFGAGNGIISRNMPIIADHTAGYNGYMTDMTRTYYIGEIGSKFVDAHNFCVELHKEILKKMVPGAIPSEIYLWTLEEAEKAGYGDHYMNYGPNKVRFLGHGVGIELDEWPVLAKPFRDPLEKGMVVAVEPKIIFPDGGVGVEDTVIVGENEVEVVTPMEYELIKVG